MTARRAGLTATVLTFAITLTAVPSGATAAPRGATTDQAWTATAVGNPPSTSAVQADGVGARGLLPTAVASDFDPGNIISDTVFFDPGAMTVDQVQAFLDARGAGCAAGEQPCLKDFRDLTVAKAADGLCNGYPGGLWQSAAQIVVGVAQSCHVNPRVLLVLLEKEQSLVTRTRPTTYAYLRATGFGCPDSAPCNAQYFGLFNQVYLAARQYQKYAAYPDQYPRYRPGRSNTILYHPNAACGTSSVYIQNQATAGLYTYTPYRPNAAALANLYGTGDSCSAYGNRNFWRLFTDWFGSTQGGGFLARTADNPTLYLISGNTKYPIPSLEIMNAYAPLGPVSYVSQVYLDRWATGQRLTRFVLGSDSGVYFVDAGTRHRFGTCTQVADFGGFCGALVRLTDVQITALTAGASMSNTVRTSSGRTYYIAGGTRREAADTQALVEAGLPTTTVTLSDAGISGLPVADPIIRAGVVLRNRATGQTVLSSSTGANPVPTALLSGTRLGALPLAGMDDASMARLTQGAALSPFVRTAAGTYLLRGNSITELTDTSPAPQSTALVGAEVLAGFIPTGAVGAPLFVQPLGETLRYKVVAGTRLPVRSDAELVALGGTPEAVLAVRPEVASLMPIGRDAALTRFDDVRITDQFPLEIEWLAASGITRGTSPTTYSPAEPVRRDAMAAFLYRYAGSPAFTPLIAPTFTDIPTAYIFHHEVEWLAASGITRGTSPTTYSPADPVRRDAMAAFLYRYAGSPAFTPPATPTFADVPADYLFYAEIEWLAATGITRGTSPTTYSPADPVRRDAMAAFLYRLAQL
jgi:hypothetical protein